MPLTASDGSGRTVMNLYLFDTGTDAKGGGYEAFDPAIIDWYRKTRDALKAETGHYVPSLVFQHIPMPEYYHVLRRVKKSEKGAIQAFRTHKNEFYKLGDTCRPGDMLEEPPSIPDINNGEFDALHEKGDILGVFVGHDHKNSFVVDQLLTDFINADGIWLFMRHINDIRVIFVLRFFAGCALHTGLNPVFLTLKRHSKQRSHHFLS